MLHSEIISLAFICGIRESLRSWSCETRAMTEEVDYSLSDIIGSGAVGQMSLIPENQLDVEYPYTHLLYNKIL